MPKRNTRKIRPPQVADARRPPLNWRRCAALTLQALRKAALLRSAVVVLIGSYARNTVTWRSDVDILVITPLPNPLRISVPHGVHVHFEDKEEFVSKFHNGDDYAVSSVRYGKLLYDRTNFWNSLREGLETTKWPSWSDKINHAERRLKLGHDLLDMGDLDAATEEYLLAATQLARTTLLQCGIYPLSRPEISEQLVAIGHGGLAADITLLIEGRSDKEELERISRGLSRMLESNRSVSLGGDD